MKTLPLKEVLKLATPGPYEIRVSEPWRVYSKNARSMVLSGFGHGDEPRVNAALSTHSMNVRDELIEQVRALSLLLAETRGDDDPDVLRAEAALAKARTVEMP